MGVLTRLNPCFPRKVRTCRRTTHSCCCRSADRSSRPTSCRSWKTSRVAGESRASGSRKSGSTTSSSAAAARSTTRTAPCSRRSARTSPGAASTSRSTGATATGTPTSRGTLTRMRTTGSPAPPSSPPRPTRPTRPAGSTARTSRMPWPRSKRHHASIDCGSTSTTPASWSRSWTRRCPALAELPDSVRERAELVFVTHSIPTEMAATSGRGRRRLRAPAPQRRLGGHRPSASGDGPSSRPRPCLLLALRLATTPWLEPDVNDHLATYRRARHPRRRAGARGLRLRPHGGHLRPRHGGPGHRREARAGGRAGRDPGVDPRFVAMVRDLLVERAAAERGEDVERAAVGDLVAWPGICAVGCCPNPRGERPALCGLDA